MNEDHSKKLRLSKIKNIYLQFKTRHMKKYGNKSLKNRDSEKTV